MYLRAIHAEPSIKALRDFIRTYPLGVLTTALSSPNFPLLQSTHIPWVLDVEDESSEDELGRLRGHMARPNPHSKALIEAASAQSPSGSSSVLEQEVMVLFTHPINHYVTPKYYIETKPLDGKVVPTWNYAAAQAYGKARIYFDSKSDETSSFLMQQLEDLTKLSETDIMRHDGAEGRPGPWKVSDAPERYIELRRSNIIGIEIEVERLEGKFKMSQELDKGDRKGVVEGFQGMGNDLGRVMADLVVQRHEIKVAEKKVNQ